MNDADSGRVFVQVIPIEQGGEIGWGLSVTDLLGNRREDIRTAIAAGAKAVAESLAELPGAEGWRLGEVSAEFGVTLTAQAGVILSQASAGATFKVTVRYQREH